MTDPLEDLDAQLRESGEKWRASRAAPPPIDSRKFSDSNAHPGASIRALPAIAGLAALTLVAAIVIVSLRPLQNLIASASPSAPASLMASETANVSPSGLPDSPAPSPTLTATPSTSAAPTESPGFWTSIQSPDFPGIGDGFDGIWVANGQFVGQAHRCDASTCTFVLLESPDAAIWTKVARIDLDPNDGQSVIFFHDEEFRYVAASSNGHQGDGVGMWLSTDGINWTFVGNQPAFTANQCGTSVHQGTDIHQLYRTGSLLVALAGVYCTDFGTAATWSSADGKTWQDSEPNYHVFGVVEGHGSFFGSVPGHRSVVYRSSDGLSWTPASGLSVDCSYSPVADGYVAVCHPPFGGPELFTSSDGLTWKFRDTSNPPLPNGPLSSDGFRAVLMGYQTSDGMSLSSPDGATWTRFELPHASGQQIDGLAILGDRVVAWSNESPIQWVANIPTTDLSAAPTLGN